MTQQRTYYTATVTQLRWERQLHKDPLDFQFHGQAGTFEIQMDTPLSGAHHQYASLSPTLYWSILSRIPYSC